MTVAAQCAAARALRYRLMHPVNAVTDIGIDLKRPKTPAPPPRPPMLLATVHPVTVDPPPPKRPRLPGKRELRRIRLTPLIAKVVGIVAEFYGLNIGDLYGDRRHTQIVHARQMAAYLARELPDATFPEIGVALHYADHTSVMFGVRQIADRLLVDPLLEAEVEQLRLLLKPEMEIV